MSARDALLSTAKDDWRTPPAVVAWAAQRWGPFGLDAAAGPGASVMGLPSIGPDASESGALGVPWIPPGGGAVWCNPPYSRSGGGLVAWHQKALQESRRRTVVMLVPATIDRGWAHRAAWHADEWVVFRWRIAFIDPATGKPAGANVVGSMFVVYQPHTRDGGWPGGPRLSYIGRDDLEAAP